MRVIGKKTFYNIKLFSFFATGRGRSRRHWYKCNSSSAQRVSLDGATRGDIVRFALDVVVEELTTEPRQRTRADRSAEYQRRKRNKARDNAARRLRHAVANGLVVRATHCHHCGVYSESLQGHHHDYARALDVIFVCTRCHANIHKEERQSA